MSGSGEEDSDLDSISICGPFDDKKDECYSFPHSKYPRLDEVRENQVNMDVY